MTKKRALELAKGWHDSHDEAEAEEAAGCFGAAERLRMDAADIEHELRKVGYDATKLWEEISTERRAADLRKAAELDKAAARHRKRLTGK